MSTEDQQWDLVSGQWSGASTSDSLVKSALEGSFGSVLLSHSARRLLTPFAKALTSLSHQSSSVRLRNVSVQIGQDEGLCLDAMAVAVYSLHAFIQLNWTGPNLSEELASPVSLLRRVAADFLPARNLESDAEGDSDAQLDSTLQQACLEELTWNGEPAYHLCQSAFFLVFTLCILDSLPLHLITLPWWKLRAASVHSRILDTPMMPSDALFTSLQPLEERLRKMQEQDVGQDERARWGAILARLCIDNGLALQRCGNEKEANDKFVEAAAASGLRYAVTGALGRKTKFQKEEKTILVLLAESSLSDGGNEEERGEDGDEAEDGEEETDDVGTLPSNRAGWKAGPSASQEMGMPSEMSLNDDTLLEQTRFSSTSGGASELSGLYAANPKPLHPLDSATLLSLSLNINNTSPENGLTSSQISAFVSRVLAHARNWSVHTMALLLRSRLEANRTRTAQRSVLQLQALLDQMPSSDSPLPERLLYFHELELPSTWEMQAELAKRYAALGVIKSALEMFERLEMWEEAVLCWGAVGRQDRGIEVVRELLEGKKVESSQAILERKQGRKEEVKQTLNRAREAKLWCLLGDLEVDKAEDLYQMAWKVSGQRSARAARSIAGLAFAKDDFQLTILWLRRALKVNPLYTRSWFVLGCAYMRLDTAPAFLEAARCFRRCTSLDDEDGESWNNLASCYLRLSQQGPGVLYDAQLAENGGSVRDATEVLRGVGLEGGQDEGEESDRDSLHSRDSGVAVDESDTETEEDEGRAHLVGSTNGSSSSTFDVKLLAHRALTKSLRFSHDDWRVWNNYMIVSVDCGLMGEAVRGLTRVVELRSSRASAAGTADVSSFVDVAVLNRLVDAVIRAPSKEEDAVEEAGEVKREGQINHSPHEGHGLFPTLYHLFDSVILSRISSSPAIYRAYARLLFWRGLFRSALEAHLSAWRVSYGSDANVQVTTEKASFVDAVDELRELCEILENFGEKQTHIDGDGQECYGNGAKVEEAMGNWKFRARSLVRSFIGRTKDSFEDEPQWDNLVELRDSLKTG